MRCDGVKTSLCGPLLAAWARLTGQLPAMHRHKYVEEQMEKRLGVKKADARQAGPLDPEQALYVTPEELKVWPRPSCNVLGICLQCLSDAGCKSLNCITNSCPA